MVRFDKPCVQVGAAVKYFRVHMAKSDYLSQDGRQELTWIGEGAKRLGLSGLVEEATFARLCEGRHPITGEKLGVRQNGPVRRVCYFGQISPPKDVSIAYLVGNDQRIAEWWKEAVRETMQEMEAVTATRIRKGGVDNQDRFTGNMIAAMVTHDASRALDPQLHTHVCVMNVTYDDVEQQWKSVQPEGFYQHQGYLREVCYNRLAKKMTDAGYEVERARKIGFHIKGFPAALREQFSKRHEEIEREAESLNVSSQDGKQRIAGSTRKEKVSAEPEQLRRLWREASGVYLEDIQGTIDRAIGQRLTRERYTVSHALDQAQAHVFERHAVINERALLREALIFGRADVSLTEMKDELETRICKGELIRKGQDIVSKEMLRLEREYLDWALENKRRHDDLGRVGNLDPELTAEQREAVCTILFNRDQVIIFQGKAGTGKTRTLKEIIRGIEKSGKDVFACAPSSGATEVLRNDLGVNADTLQQLLVNQSLQRRIANKVIIVDEAGLVSTDQMCELSRIAREHNNRLLLTGDIGQHSSVQAGDALRALQKYGNVATAHLTKIRRQRTPAFRRAVSLLADKKAYQAFNAFRRLGAVKEVRDPKMLMQLATDDYMASVRDGKSCLVISPVWADIHRFTEGLRPKLKARGVLAPKDREVFTFHSYQWTTASRKDARNYQKGDVLAFHKEAAGFKKGDYVTVNRRHGKTLVVQRVNGDQMLLDPGVAASFDTGLVMSLPIAAGERLLLRANLKDHRLFNGNIVEVVAIRDDGTIELTDGRKIPADFRQFSYGYATTSHASQGKTVKRGIVLITGEGIAAANLKQAYVSHSRFEETHVTYVTDEKKAISAMATPADRDLAIEVANERIRRDRITAKLTEQAEAWAERHQAVAVTRGPQSSATR